MIIIIISDMVCFIYLTCSIIKIIAKSLLRFVCLLYVIKIIIIMMMMMIYSAGIDYKILYGIDGSLRLEIVLRAYC